jgi:hypothetical protein
MTKTIEQVIQFLNAEIAAADTLYEKTPSYSDERDTISFKSYFFSQVLDFIGR